MFAKVFYSIAHFVFILHLLFACVLWLRARGNVKMQALALLMALLAVFFLLKLWAFGLVLHPLDLRPALMSGYVTMVLCMVPRIWFTSPPDRVPEFGERPSARALSAVSLSDSPSVGGAVS